MEGSGRDLISSLWWHFGQNIFFWGGGSLEHAFNEPFETALFTHLSVRNFILLVSEDVVFPAC